ncbi:GNAT family N-acetyltransferase [Acidovorax sp. BLS4]|uniref:GNAT family N-acetyltransferase n=1 Tax=Acidovorax sp. BLS4 TaxID=3273430 RepID=UPI00294346E1|nr:GNAT family N-acetyltransferase [Paracidovorax avenae]WOI45334.1 GNAT family N-acetyltransferase [Paracidovorax avenae]
MSYQEMKASVELLPAQAPKFETERFVVVPLGPEPARDLLNVLLQDERLAGQLPWMVEKSADGACKEAFLIGLQCAAETTLVWGIVERARSAYIGAVLARSTLEGLDVEVLCASQFWNQGVADEAGLPVADWLEEHAAVELVPAA